MFKISVTPIISVQPTSRKKNSRSKFPKAGLTIMRGRLVKRLRDMNIRCFVYKNYVSTAFGRRPNFYERL